MQALTRGDMASVAVLVQAALCAPIEGVIVENEEKLSIISMGRSENARIDYEYLFLPRVLTQAHGCPGRRLA